MKTLRKSKYKETEIGGIPEGWVETSLKEVAETISQTHSFSNKKEIIFINTGDIQSGTFLHSNYLKVDMLPGQAKKMIKRNDILFSEIRPKNQRYAFVNFTNTEDYVVSTKLMVIRAKENILPEYLYRILINKNTLDEFQQIAESRSGTFPQITFDSIKEHPILLPSFSEQRAIAKILSDLDEKIELNNQMNKTLEAIAQSIFKEWFIDFHFPGFEKTKFTNGLPADWKKGKMVDVCDIVMGQSPPGETYNESGNGMPFYQGNRDFGYRFPTARIYCSAPTRYAEKGDILISVRAPVGAFNITLEKCAIGRGLASLRMKNYSNGFIFYFLSEKKDLWEQYNSEGTVFGCLNKTELQKIDLAIPPDAILNQFDVVIKPIEAMIRRNEEENRRLSDIRDSLLPKLMSGKIRILN